MRQFNLDSESELTDRRKREKRIKWLTGNLHALIQYHLRPLQIENKSETSLFLIKGIDYYLIQCLGHLIVQSMKLTQGIRECHPLEDGGFLLSADFKKRDNII